LSLTESGETHSNSRRKLGRNTTGEWRSLFFTRLLDWTTRTTTARLIVRVFSLLHWTPDRGNEVIFGGLAVPNEAVYITDQHESVRRQNEKQEARVSPKMQAAWQVPGTEEAAGWASKKKGTYLALASLTLTLGLAKSSLSLWLCSNSRRNFSSHMDWRPPVREFMIDSLWLGQAFTYSQKLSVVDWPQSERWFSGREGSVASRNVFVLIEVSADERDWLDVGKFLMYLAGLVSL